MKKQFVAELKSGDTVSDIFILSEKNLAAKKDGNSYMHLTISDKTGDIRGVVWENVDQIASAVDSGDVVHIEGSISEYRGALQIVVRKMETYADEIIDPGVFLPSTQRDIEEMFERLLMMIDTIEKDYIKSLFKVFWGDADFVSRFKDAPAGKKMHHAYIGGLLEHTLSMATLADKISGHYTGVDRDLLIAGAVLHDIGKIHEYSYRLHIDYSDKGRMLSHIAIGLEMLNEKLNAIDDFPEEDAMLLKHMLISHHGAREFGSLEPPKTIEAVLLNYIDEIDAKVNGIREFIHSEETGERWTSYHRVLNRHFYIGPDREGQTGNGNSE